MVLLALILIWLGWSLAFFFLALWVRERHDRWVADLGRQIADEEVREMKRLSK